MPRRVNIEVALLAAAIGLTAGVFAVGIPCALAIAEQPAPIVQRIYHVQDHLCLHGGCVACGVLDFKEATP